MIKKRRRPLKIIHLNLIAANKRTETAVSQLVFCFFVFCLIEILSLLFFGGGCFFFCFFSNSAE